VIDSERKRAGQSSDRAAEVQATPSPPNPPLEGEGLSRTAVSSKRKLSFKDARELEQLPARIEKLEADVAARTQAMHDPAFYKQDAAAIAAAGAAMTALQAELDAAYARWQALDG
jgi:ATP-binding cassette subfamily F protein uup